MKCPRCNAELPNQNSAFCPYCGQSLQASQPVNGNPYGNPYAGNNQPFRDSSYQNPGNSPSPEEFQSAMKGLNTMVVLTIVTLVLMFVPYLNIISWVLLLIILIMSLFLTDRTKRIFDKAGYPVYSLIVAGIKTKCKILLGIQVLYFIGGFALGFASAVSPEAGSENATLILGTCAVFIIISIIALFLQIYCFVRLFTVKNAITQLSVGVAIPEKPGRAAVIWAVCGVTLLIGIAVVGIVAAIALPAYAKYMSRARFSEITAGADGVRRAVELCYLENGSLDRCSTGKGVQGNGWILANPEDYSTKYIARIEVKKGVITATAIQANGLRGSTIIYVPEPHGKTLNWKTSERSTCKHNDLC
ncbi:zinc-ribbon domain-containing protein [Succinimonas amylolytica]|uniref:zinc-ribbon domain-containing protein n=1 Tax=Succinimonas amylolytica TaxID=83769 RepID=UPI000364CB57|nr:zinc-ribbon domain-containing protein [Succinimonas amylolytica]